MIKTPHSLRGFLTGTFRLLFTLRSFSVGGLSPDLLITPSPDYLLAVPEMRMQPSENCYKIKFFVKIGQLPGVIYIFLEILWKVELNIQKEKTFFTCPQD
jgi:hypothetical protein